MKVVCLESDGRIPSEGVGQGKAGKERASKVFVNRWVGATDDGVQPCRALLRKHRPISQRCFLSQLGGGVAFIHRLLSPAAPGVSLVGLLKAEPAGGMPKITPREAERSA